MATCYAKILFDRYMAGDLTKEQFEEATCDKSMMYQEDLNFGAKKDIQD